MRNRILLAMAAACLVLTACGASPAPADETVPAGDQPVVISPATPNSAGYHVNRAQDVADQLDQRNADLEGLTP